MEIGLEAARSYMHAVAKGPVSPYALLRLNEREFSWKAGIQNG
jgi:hypothetical protein